MLKLLEKIFGFRTSENTNVKHYLNRMDTMGKLDGRKTNELMASFIEKFMEIDKIIESLESKAMMVSDDLEKAVSEHLSASPGADFEERLAVLEESEKKRQQMAKARSAKKSKTK